MLRLHTSPPIRQQPGNRKSNQTMTDMEPISMNVCTKKNLQHHKAKQNRPCTKCHVKIIYDNKVNVLFKKKIYNTGMQARMMS